MLTFFRFHVIEVDYLPYASIDIKEAQPRKYLRSNNLTEE